MRMLGDLLLIRRREPETVSAGGIVIPEVAAETLQEGEIVSAGSGKVMNGWVREMSVKVGDKVLFSKHGHQEVKIDGEPMVVLHEDSIVGVLE